MGVALAFKLPKIVWVVALGLQNALTALFGLRTAGILEDKKGGGAEDYTGSMDRKPGE